jgi:hypothetical protein
MESGVTNKTGAWRYMTHFLPSKSPHNLFLPTFSVSKQRKNPLKLCKTYVQNMQQEVTSYHPCRILSKEISKAVRNSKIESIQ